MKKASCIFVFLALALCASLIPASKATSVVTEDEKVLYYYNQALVSFKVKIVFETEEDGGWRVINSTSSKRGYAVTFFVTVTYLNSDMLDYLNIGELRINFHDPYVSGSINQEITFGLNETWFQSHTLYVNYPLQVIVKPSYEGEYEVKPRFSFDMYNQTYFGGQHLFYAGPAYWDGEYTYIETSKSSRATSDVVQSELDSLKTELNTIRDLFYVVILMVIILIVVAVFYLLQKKPKNRAPVSPAHGA